MPTDVETLKEMGFSEDRARRAIAKTGYKGVQVAMDWCFAHEDDPDVDDPFEEHKGYSLTDAAGKQEDTGSTSQATAVEAGSETAENTHMGEGETAETQSARSLKCDDCGKILRNVEEAEFHAVKSGHSNFSESTDEKKPLTQEEKAEQLIKVQEKIKQKRVEREETEKQEKIQREKLRRVQGKDLVSAKAKFEEDEIKRMAELRRKEKEEDKLARQRVKDEIEKDKRERAAKFSKQSETTPAPASAQSTPPKQSTPKEYTEARIQVRLPSGQALTNTFNAKEELAAVRLYIQINRKDGDSSPFKLMVSFPRKVFSEEDMQKPLSELGLVPSAVLIVTKAT